MKNASRREPSPRYGTKNLPEGNRVGSIYQRRFSAKCLLMINGTILVFCMAGVYFLFSRNGAIWDTGVLPVVFSGQNQKISGSVKGPVTKVAIFADATLNGATIRVLELVKNERADMVIHSGDVDYKGDPTVWRKQTEQVLGENFPYFFSAGNYENKGPTLSGEARENHWDKYVAERNRILSALNVKCSAKTKNSTQMACNYMGISFVLSNLSNLKTQLKEDREFIKVGLDSLEETFPESKWRFCVWHAPFYTMQLGFRPPPLVMRSLHLEDAYEECRKHGAVIVTGHEHYYVRTHTMDSFKSPYEFRGNNIPADAEVLGNDRTKDSSSLRGDEKSNVIVETKGGEADFDMSVPLLEVKPGSSFALVSGLGGHSVSVPSLTLFTQRSHLAVVHPLHMLTTTDPGGKVIYSDVSGHPDTSSNLIEGQITPHGLPFGALFCELPISRSDNSDGYCYFKTIDNHIVDEFYVQNY
eukprot:CAMPEP_0203760636 /NCGR_PEP_ID=MMETSP0098-20131031/13892_1 /ASSEMBLY_ACC=CAM_ASM_000208 /TAXON_ID=96639 /ORGANISM=" , Strain NY0313808BC1" /LENGTH=470 /DNA_ID=CAMNT_0050654293 /DNA_START=124 /DNA_END=1533 /DNA_ORIENTATION=-